MDDAAQTLRDQIEHWEGQETQAEETLRIARVVLPGMREALRVLTSAEEEAPEPGPESAGEWQMRALAAPSSESEEPESEEPDTDSGPPPRPLQEVRRAQDIRAAVRDAVKDGLPGEHMTQIEIIEAMARAGYSVNTSTLRGNLLAMAREGDRLKVEVKGGGRRATVFELI